MVYRYSGKYQLLEVPEIEDLCRDAENAMNAVDTNAMNAVDTNAMDAGSMENAAYSGSVIIRYRNEDYHYIHTSDAFINDDYAHTIDGCINNDYSHTRSNDCQKRGQLVLKKIKELNPENKSVTVQPAGRHFFASTDKTLMMLTDDGKHRKTFKGETVEVKRNGFLIRSDPNYFVNFSGEAIFINLPKAAQADLISSSVVASESINGGKNESINGGKNESINGGKSESISGGKNESISGNTVLEHLSSNKSNDTGDPSSKETNQSTPTECLNQSTSTKGTKILEFISNEKFLFLENAGVNRNCHLAGLSNCSKLNGFWQVTSEGDALIDDMSGTLKYKRIGLVYCFDSYGEALLEIDQIKIYRNTASIASIIETSCIRIESPENEHAAFLILCKHHFYIIYEDIVIEKCLKNVYLKIDLEKCEIHSYLFSEGFNDMLFAILIFYKVAPTWSTANGAIEQLICLLIANNIEAEHIYRFVGNLNHPLQKHTFDGASHLHSPSLACNTTHHPYNTQLCKAYRLTDDRGRSILDKLICFDSLSVDDLRYVIIYREDKVEDFVAMCKRQKRLFYLPDLVRFYEATNRRELIKEHLLLAGIVPLLSGQSEITNAMNGQFGIGITNGDDVFCALNNVDTFYDEMEAQRKLYLYERNKPKGKISGPRKP